MPCDCPCIGGLEGFADALKTIDGDEYYKTIQKWGFLGIYVDDGRVPGAQSYAGGPACGFAMGTGPDLDITIDEADQCISLLTSLVAINNLAPCPKL
jgi:hypothetical protein